MRTCLVLQRASHWPLSSPCGDGLGGDKSRGRGTAFENGGASRISSQLLRSYLGIQE